MDPVTTQSPTAPVERGSNLEAAEIYRQMFLIRRFEETALELFKRGLVNGTVHTCIGQEPCAVGVVGALDKERDVLFSNHRGHGHFLSFTDNCEGLVAEIMGRASGVCGGVGGSQHLHQKNFYSNGIQGGIVPVSTGIALAEKLQGTGAVSTVFVGDGTMGEGVVYESMNIAATWGLPVLYVVENNGIAQTTPLKLAHKSDFASRAAGFGIETRRASGFDVWETRRAASDLVSLIRKNSVPGFLHLETYRLGPHSKGDDTRDEKEVASFRERDPLRLFGRTLEESLRRQIEEAVEQRMVAAVESSAKAPFQNFDEYRRRCVLQGVYAQ